MTAVAVAATAASASHGVAGPRALSAVKNVGARMPAKASVYFLGGPAPIMAGCGSRH
jgi:hypothetical protein